jgi:hypothetical protein
MAGEPAAEARLTLRRWKVYTDYVTQRHRKGLQMKRLACERIAAKHAEAFDCLHRPGQSAFTGLYRLSIVRHQ